MRTTMFLLTVVILCLVIPSEAGVFMSQCANGYLQLENTKNVIACENLTSSSTVIWTLYHSPNNYAVSISCIAFGRNCFQSNETFSATRNDTTSYLEINMEKCPLDLTGYNVECSLGTAGNSSMIPLGNAACTIRHTACTTKNGTSTTTQAPTPSNTSPTPAVSSAISMVPSTLTELTTMPETNAMTTQSTTRSLSPTTTSEPGTTSNTISATTPISAPTGTLISASTTKPTITPIRSPTTTLTTTQTTTTTTMPMTNPTTTPTTTSTTTPTTRSTSTPTKMTTIDPTTMTTTTTTTTSTTTPTTTITTMIDPMTKTSIEPTTKTRTATTTTTPSTKTHQTTSSSIPIPTTSTINKSTVTPSTLTVSSMTGHPVPTSTLGGDSSTNQTEPTGAAYQTTDDPDTVPVAAIAGGVGAAVGTITVFVFIIVAVRRRKRPAYVGKPGTPAVSSVPDGIEDPHIYHVLEKPYNSLSVKLPQEPQRPAEDHYNHMTSIRANHVTGQVTDDPCDTLDHLPRETWKKPCEDPYNQVTSSPANHVAGPAYVDTGTTSTLTTSLMTSPPSLNSTSGFDSCTNHTQTTEVAYQTTEDPDMPVAAIAGGLGAAAVANAEFISIINAVRRRNEREDGNTGGSQDTTLSLEASETAIAIGALVKVVEQAMSDTQHNPRAILNGKPGTTLGTASTASVKEHNPKAVIAKKQNSNTSATDGKSNKKTAWSLRKSVTPDTKMRVGLNVSEEKPTLIFDNQAISQPEVGDDQDENTQAWGGTSALHASGAGEGNESNPETEIYATIQEDRVNGHTAVRPKPKVPTKSAAAKLKGPAYVGNPGTPAVSTVPDGFEDSHIYHVLEEPYSSLSFKQTQEPQRPAEDHYNHVTSIRANQLTGQVTDDPYNTLDHLPRKTSKKPNGDPYNQVTSSPTNHVTGQVTDDPYNTLDHSLRKTSNKPTEDPYNMVTSPPAIHDAGQVTEDTHNALNHSPRKTSQKHDDYSHV